MDNYSDYLSGKDCDTDSLRRARLEKAISEDEFGYIEDPERFSDILCVLRDMYLENWRAAYELGILYLDGIYIDRDCQYAFTAFKKAMELCPKNDDSRSAICTALGYCHLFGIGTKKDADTAERYLLSALNYGDDPLASLLLGDLYHISSESGKNGKKAADHYWRAALTTELSSYLDKNWRIVLYLKIRNARNELYYDLSSRHDIDEYDREYYGHYYGRYEEAKIESILSVITDMTEACIGLEGFCDRAKSETVRNEYHDLKKDLLNAADIYGGIDPDWAYLKEECAGRWYIIEYIMEQKQQYLKIMQTRNRLGA